MLDVLHSSLSFTVLRSSSLNLLKHYMVSHWHDVTHLDEKCIRCVFLSVCLLLTSKKTAEEEHRAAACPVLQVLSQSIETPHGGLKCPHKPHLVSETRKKKSDINASFCGCSYLLEVGWKTENCQSLESWCWRRPKRTCCDDRRWWGSSWGHSPEELLWWGC